MDSEFKYSSKTFRLISFLFPTNNANGQFGSETIIDNLLMPILEYSAASFNVKFNFKCVGIFSLSFSFILTNSCCTKSTSISAFQFINCLEFYLRLILHYSKLAHSIIFINYCISCGIYGHHPLVSITTI